MTLSVKELLSVPILLKVFPHAKLPYIEVFTTHYDQFECRGLITPLRIIHFLSQCGCETGGFIEFDELPHPNNGGDYGNYENRPEIGNIHQGDGVKYRGRGCISLTGRGNYRWIGRSLSQK